LYLYILISNDLASPNALALARAATGWFIC